MADDRPRGSCVIAGCPRDPYPRDGRVPLVCGPDVSAMRHWLVEIPECARELGGGGFVMRDPVGGRLELLIEDEEARWFEPVARYGVPPARLAREDPDHPLVLRAGAPVEHRDLVANVLPAGPLGSAGRGGRVSGSPEPRSPVPLDALDLLARPRTTSAATAPLAYPEQDDDQIGFLPVAAMLDARADDLRRHRRKGEGRPEPSITVLCGWLLKRLDDACDDWPPIDELFLDLKQAYGALRGQLGRIETVDYCDGVPCPKCSLLALVRQPGQDWIVCTACQAYFKITEYEEYVMTLATALSTEERERRRKAAQDRRALVRLLREMHAVGWRHSAEIEVEDTDLVFTHHYWRRPGQRISASVQSGAGAYDCVRLKRVDADDYGEDDVAASVSWIESAGLAQLHKAATTFGVLSVPKERG